MVVSKKKRLTAIQIGKAFDSLSGKPEARLETLVERSGLPLPRVLKHLGNWKAKQWLQENFPDVVGNGYVPPHNKETVLAALNKGGSMLKSAKLLKTTPITLKKWVGIYKVKQTIEYGLKEHSVTWR